MNYDWYPMNPIHWKRDTLLLSLAEDGAYRRLVDEYYISREPLPDSDAALARIIGVGLDEWLSVSVAVRAFFEASNGRLIHKRCEEELNAQVMQTQCTRIKKQAAANSRWAKDRELKEINARALREQSSSNAVAMQNDTTRQRKKDKEEPEARKDGSLATALPTGALREPLSRTQASPALQRLVAAKGWA